MTKALADMFADAETPRLDWEGEPAYAIYEIPAPNAFDVEFLSSTNLPTQGLALKAYGGVLQVNGVAAEEMVLWRDTAPNRVPVKVKSEAAREVTLKIWNVWRCNVGGHQVTQAWLGNAGMRVKHVGALLRLNCSDGEGSVNFNDLAVRLTVTD